ncbi:ABC transporter ATP-binding protein [Rhodobacteraceae bacterium 63075]|nr:ABC transporter ATP-binding protein [Rhodobacteraceae bacterium 63075]
MVWRAAGLIDPERPAKGAPPDALWPFARWCLSGAWPIIALAGFISALSGASEVLSMYVLGRIVDLAAADAALGEHLWLLALGAFLLIGLRPLFFGLNAAFQTVVLGPNLFKQILARLNRWTLGQSVGYFDDDYAGRLAQKQMQATRSLTEVVIETVNAILFALASVVGSALLVMAIDLRLLALLGLWILLYAAYLRYFLPRIRVRSKERAAAQAMVSGQVVDTITNIKTVKLFAGDAHEEAATSNVLEILRERAVDFGELSSVFRYGLIFVAGLLPVALVGGALIWRDAGVSAGDIAATGAVSIRLAQMSGWISFVLMTIYMHLGEVEDGMQTLAPAKRLRAGRGERLDVSRGEIVFEDVSFAYGRDVGGVEDIRLRVAPGEKLGIVGASGAGKSTLVSLLLRLYDPEEGRVCIDGQDISEVSEESLRRAIGMVTQETALFNRSARENITYGREDATEAAMLEAIEKAEAQDFIHSLRDGQGRMGLDAHLGERGVKLSGGQRQRIALARTILKDAPILVLDEATSALDSEVEASIQGALETVMEGKTVLAIAHRLSTIAAMDRIIVMREGRIVEEGSHDDLLAEGGIYADLWAHQSGGFLGT